MKLIGILGGMGWEASAQYYRRLNELSLERQGNMASAEIILSSVNNRLVGQMMYHGKWGDLQVYLQEKIQKLEAAGADTLLMACNSVHYLADDLKFNVPFLHIADAVVNEAKCRGDKTLMLLGTQFTCKETFYRHHLEKNGLKVLLPNEHEMLVIHQFIYHKLKKGHFPIGAELRFQKLLSMFQSRADGLVLACTELPLLCGESLPVFCYDTIELHCEMVADLGGI